MRRRLTRTMDEARTAYISDPRSYDDTVEADWLAVYLIPAIAIVTAFDAAVLIYQWVGS